MSKGQHLVIDRHDSSREAEAQLDQLETQDTESESAPRRPRRLAIRSAVSWALLGLVIERPSYGYELSKRFERRYAQYLPIRSGSHIYRSLKTLKCEGLIEQTCAARGPQATRRARPWYGATERGVLGYCKWLETTALTQLLPSEVFVCALAALRRRPDAALSVIASCERAYLLRVEEIGDRGRFALHKRAPTDLAGRLLSAERRLAIEVTLPWISYARHEFEALDAARLKQAQAA